ncbi:hypothetical protein TNCV_316721 [Trichonephila clavipes]|nr:hypothetical protein TNCV_316721 [Trichonephila clavipes]
MFDPSSFAGPTPLAHADTSRDVLPRGETSQSQGFLAPGVRYMNSEVQVDILDKAALQTLCYDLNPPEYLWDELERKLHAILTASTHCCCGGRLEVSCYGHLSKTDGKSPQMTTQPTSHIGTVTSTFAGLKEDMCSKDSLAADQR